MTATSDPPQAPVSLEELRRSNRLRDFDDPEIYSLALDEAVAAGTRNFVVRFGEVKAEIAIDIDRDELQPLLNIKNRGDFPLCWINIWDPSQQEDLIRVIGKKYGFSQRLQKSVTVWDEFKRVYKASKNKQSRQAEPRKSHSSRHEKDLEQGATADNGHADVSPEVNPLLQPENVATFRLLHSSLNYTTIDQGDDFLCIGANWLHRRPTLKDGKTVDDAPLVPPKHWSWFTLCNDNTVISFHESPVYDKTPDGEDETDWRRRELGYMRSNTQKVLRHLSQSISKQDKANFLQLTDVRRLLRSRDTSTHQIGQTGELERQKDCASNLFYYLFEDYAAAIVILGETNRILQKLREGVLNFKRKKSFKKDTTIRNLHELSMELRQLRHLFESYKMLISRLLDTQPMPSEESINMTPAAASRLSRRCRDRFQRLSDRLQLLMLNPIQEYLDEKNSLSDTYFNLTAQKDSEATARLTRSATLLAKLSVFFLPITFITAFFSVQVPGLLDGYNGDTYWGVFGVTVGISFIALFFFSRVLMWVSEALDENIKQATRSVMRLYKGDADDSDG